MYSLASLRCAVREKAAAERQAGGQSTTSFRPKPSLALTASIQACRSPALGPGGFRPSNSSFYPKSRLLEVAAYVKPSCPRSSLTPSSSSSRSSFTPRAAALVPAAPVGAPPLVAAGPPSFLPTASPTSSKTISPAVPSRPARRRSLRGGAGLPGLAQGEQSGVHPWRSLAPLPKRRRKGTALGVDSAAVAPMLAALDQAAHAPSTLRAKASRWNWWTARCRARALPPLPVDLDTFKLAGAMLLHGGYTSGAQYLATIKGRHIRAKFDWYAGLDLVYQDAKRALVRGVGRPVQAGEFDLETLATLERSGKLRELASLSWPAAGFDVLVVFCAWVLREIESGAAFLDAVTFEDSPPSCGCATWTLPCSKTDIAAIGKPRTLRCGCRSPGTLDTLCPVRALRHVAACSSSACAEAEEFGAHSSRWPLIVDGRGNPMQKAGIVAFYREVVAASGAPVSGISGHSCRVTGARNLSRAGNETAVIQAFARWGPHTILRYLRDSVLGRRGGNIKSCFRGSQVTHDVQPSLPDIEGLIKNALEIKYKDFFSSDGLSLIVKEASHTISEQFLRKDAVVQSGSSDLKIDLDAIRKQVESLQVDSKVLSGELPPTYVQCPGGLMHQALPRGTAVCGWPWKSSNHRVVLQSEWAQARHKNKGVCKRCSE